MGAVCAPPRQTRTSQITHLVCKHAADGLVRPQQVVHGAPVAAAHVSKRCMRQAAVNASSAVGRRVSDSACRGRVTRNAAASGRVAERQRPSRERAPEGCVWVHAELVEQVPEPVLLKEVVRPALPREPQHVLLLILRAQVAPVPPALGQHALVCMHTPPMPCVSPVRWQVPILHCRSSTAVQHQPV